MNWSDANLMRWTGDRLGPVGGWSKLAISATASNVRRVFQWRDSNDVNWVAYLCDAHLYVEYEGDLVDITPMGGITAPSASFIDGGYGDDEYSLDEYGTPRATRPDEKAIGWAYTLNNWGETLLAMTSVDGRLLQWDPSVLPPAPATVVAGAPVSNRCFVVTPERYVVLFDQGGVTGEFAWCDQEDITNWNFADPVSKAGFLPIEPRAKCVAAIYTPGSILHFTTNGAASIQHIGLPYIFNVDPVAGGTAPVSDRVLVRTVSGAMWMSESGSWAFNGVSVGPVQCDVWDYVQKTVDWRLARFLAAAVNIEDKSEIWFFFPRIGDSKNTLLVIYNYRDGWWSLGTLSRSAGASSTYTSYPVMADDTVVYQHETGSRMDDASELPWIESFPLQLPGGDQLTFQQLQPDVEGDFSAVRFSVKFRQQLATNDEYQSTLRSIYDGFVDIDETGRDFRLRIECIDPVVRSWTIGTSHVSAVKRGRRK